MLVGFLGRKRNFVEVQHIGKVPEQVFVDCGDVLAGESGGEEVEDGVADRIVWKGDVQKDRQGCCNVAVR